MNGNDIIGEPIRVLMINYKMQCAGIESFIMNIYRNIDRTKVQFDFLVHYAQRQFYDEEIEQLGGRIYRLTVREDNDFVKYFRDLKRFFEEHIEYMIVHGHMESFGQFYLKAAMNAGVPIRIAHSHIAQKNNDLKGMVKYWLNKGYGKYATDLFACSEIAGKFMFGENASFTVWNNAIDVEMFSFNIDIRKIMREKLDISDGQLVIGHVGRFNTQKNHTFLIDIFCEIKKIRNNAVLLLIGGGDLEYQIANKVEKMQLGESVRFMGVRKDVNMLYQAMDVFLMPSLFEGLPVSGIEAQTAGLPCVFSDTVTRETDITGNVSFISLSEKPSEWADRICKMLDTFKRENQGDTIASKGYDIKHQADMLAQYYLDAYYRGKK
jgi:glycosyltransferase involved in cell wall biosynthesis